jgi:hypothetical protein
MQHMMPPLLLLLTATSYCQGSGRGRMRSYTQTHWQCGQQAVTRQQWQQWRRLAAMEVAAVAGG